MGARALADGEDQVDAGGPADPAAVADLAGLLALAWGQPDQLLAAALIDGTWSSGIQACLALLPPGRPPVEVTTALEVVESVVEGLDAAELSRDLAAEYAALFQGPGHALVPAYGCQWLDGERASLFISPSSLAVESAYRTAGLELASREPPDSLATELEFIRHLAAVEAGEPGDAVDHRGRRRAFVSGNIGRWVAPFCDAVQQSTEHGAYAALARITAAVASAGLLAA